VGAANAALLTNSIFIALMPVSLRSLLHFQTLLDVLYADDMDYG
jgi:hypothetical protein